MFIYFIHKRQVVSSRCSSFVRCGFKGFALVELLIIISVIGILAAIIFVNVGNARAKARDTQRISDLANIKSALELHFLENGFFPFQDGSGTSIGSNAHSALPQSAGGTWGVFENALEPYLNDLPDDPLNTWNGGIEDPFPFTDTYSYWYLPDSKGIDYDLVARFETKNALRCEIKMWPKHEKPTCGISWCDPSDPLDPISASEFRKELYSVPHALLCPP